MKKFDIMATAFDLFMAQSGKSMYIFFIKKSNAPFSHCRITFRVIMGRMLLPSERSHRFTSFPFSRQFFRTQFWMKLNLREIGSFAHGTESRSSLYLCTGLTPPLLSQSLSGEVGRAILSRTNFARKQNPVLNFLPSTAFRFLPLRSSCRRVIHQ